MIAGSPIVSLLNLQPLLKRLGVQGISMFQLVPTIQPVALVDGSIQAVTMQTLDVPFQGNTGNELTNPAANTILATTGPLTVGQYNIRAMFGASEGNRLRLQRYNLSNIMWYQDFFIPTTGWTYDISFRTVCLEGDSIRVVNWLVGGASAVYQAAIWAQGPF